MNIIIINIIIMLVLILLFLIVIFIITKGDTNVDDDDVRGAFILQSRWCGCENFDVLQHC